MKILGVIDHFGSGGAQRQFVELMVGLASRGYGVEVFVYHLGDDFFRPKIDVAGIHIHECDRGTVGRIGTLRRLRHAIRQFRPDAIISFLNGSNALAEVASLGRASVLLVCERTSFRNDSSPALSFFRRGLHLLADYVLSNSHDHAAWLRGHYSWLHEKVKCIYNGIPAEFFDIVPSPKPVRVLRLLAVGRIATVKNPLILAQACALHLDRHGWTPQVTWVGREDGVEGAKLRAEVDNFLAAHPGLSDAWCWMDQSEEIPQILSEHDALVLPSRYEGLPNAACEALAAGRPVLASRVCEHPRLVGEAGERGFLFNLDDVEELLSAIEKLNSMSVEEWRDMSDRCKVFANSELTVERMVDGYEALINECLSLKREKSS